MSKEMKLTNVYIIFIIYTRYIDFETGKRSDSAHYYIYNQNHNTNLKILARHRVVRVLFECVLVFSLLISQNTYMS